MGMQARGLVSSPSRENETNIDTRNGRSSIWMEGPSDFHDAKMADRRPVSESTTALWIGISQAHHL